MAEFPTKDAVLQWIEDNPEATRRDLAKAFGIRGAAKIDFKALLKEMEEEGDFHPRKRRTREEAETGLPPVTVIEIIGPDAQGDLLAKPVDWRGDGPPPAIRVIPRAGGEGLGSRDRVL